jgi:hypothetical protein
MRSIMIPFVVALSVWLPFTSAAVFAQKSSLTTAGMDKDREESRQVTVVRPRQLYLTVGSTVPLQMTSKKPIRTVLNEREQVAVVRPMPGDPTTVLVTGLAPGWTRITLIDNSGQKEVRELGKRSSER